MADMKSLTVNGVRYTTKDAGAVRFDEEQNLSQGQKTQVRQNIGVSAPLVVTVTDTAASHTAEEIYAHVQSGGTAVCVHGTSCYNLSYADGSYVLFSFVEEDAYVYGVKILADGSWEQLEFSLADGISAVSSWKDLTDKPFYEEDSREVLFPEETLDFAVNPEFGLLFTADVKTFSLTAGETYTVLWDNMEYVCAGVDASSLNNGEEMIAIGNGTSFGLPGNGEPFAIATTADMILFFVLDTADTSASHKVAIFRGAVVLKTLEEKYLPMDAIDGRIQKALGVIENGAY